MPCFYLSFCFSNYTLAAPPPVANRVDLYGLGLPILLGSFFFFLRFSTLTLHLPMSLVTCPSTAPYAGASGVAPWMAPMACHPWLSPGCPVRPDYLYLLYVPSIVECSPHSAVTLSNSSVLPGPTTMPSPSPSIQHCCLPCCLPSLVLAPHDHNHHIYHSTIRPPPFLLG